MRRLILALVATLGLLVAGAPPADAHLLNPGQISVDTVGTCSVQSTYGTFGNGFAQYTIPSWVNSGCSALSWIKVTTVHGSHTHNQICDTWPTILNPSASCVVLTNPDGIRAVVHGTAIGMSMVVCYGPTSTPYCVEFPHSMFG